MDRLTSFWDELRRRKVIRVAIVYALVAWAMIEVASLVFPSLLFPEWTSRLVVALALMGFPVALVMAWAYELTPGGVRREASDQIEPGSRAIDDTEPPADEERLEGWKRIAAHLNRDVRTLRRWEKNEGLPIRRLMHDKQATVYAYASELEAWRQARETGQSPPAPTSARARPARTSIALIGVFAAAAIGGGAIYWIVSQQPELPFEERDWVLITSFDNRTGDEAFDDVLEYALERELSNSRFVNVVPRERVNDALVLMRKPLDTVVDVPVGREISLRDGDIKALIGGRIEHFDEEYLLSASLINPSDGVTVRSFSVDAGGEKDILPALAHLAQEVRGALGEELSTIRQGDRLSKATTTSLEALKLYTRADNLMKSLRGRYDALPLLEEAVLRDPDFASAHVLLSYLYTDLEQPGKADEHLERAVQLAEFTPDRERLFILATYYRRLGEHSKSQHTLEMLARLHPDHFWSGLSLAGSYEGDGQWRLGARERMRVADSRPNDPNMQLIALRAALTIGDTAAVERYSRRAKAIADVVPDNSWILNTLELLPIKQLWLDGDLPAVVEALDRIVAAGRTEDDPDLNYRVGAMYLALGRIEAFEAIADPKSRIHALVHLDDRDPSPVESYLEANSEGLTYKHAVLYARIGRLEEALRVIEDPRSVKNLRDGPVLIPPHKKLAVAELAIAEGRLAEAVPLLEESLSFLHRWPKDYVFIGLESLARALVRQGRVNQAISVIETYNSPHVQRSIAYQSTHLCMKNQALLLDLYRQTDRDRDAENVAAQLRKLLAVADKNHPIVMELDAMDRTLANE